MYYFIFFPFYKLNIILVLRVQILPDPDLQVAENACHDLRLSISRYTMRGILTNQTGHLENRQALLFTEIKILTN